MENSQNLQTVYKFDELGHFVKDELAQVVDDALLLPSDCVTFAPKLKEGFYYVINSERTAWQEVAFPTNASECVGIFIKHEDNSDHAYKMRDLFDELCAKSDNTYHVVQCEDLSKTVEAVPQKTQEEIEAEKLNAKKVELENDLKSIQAAYSGAQMQNNTELANNLAKTYQSKLVEYQNLGA